MSLTKISKNFYLEEFVPPEIMDQYGANAIQFIHPTIIILSQSLRDRFGPMIANDWCFGGDSKYRGFRPYYVDFNNVKNSAHKMTLAVDLFPQKTTAEAIRNEIMDDKDYWYSLGLRRVENGVPWLHIDLLDRRNGTIYFFNK